MPTELSINIQRSDLASLVDSVFDTMMNVRVEEGGIEWYPSEDRITSAVHLSGEWNGAVLIQCDKAQACMVAARFLSIECPVVVNDVVRDVMGELANMIGGNLKSMMGLGIRLSMPSVVDGSDYQFRVCGSVLRERISLHSELGPLWITLLSTSNQE